MKRRKDERGSALLMVVGLLTILAMLGGTFLVVASTHRRVALGTLAKAPLHDAPGGLLQQIASILRRDLYSGKIGTTKAGDIYAPYAATTGAKSVGNYADSVGTDPILSPGTIGGVLFPDAEMGDQVDTDRDGQPDSSLYPTGIFNSEGKQIYAAVKVIDLSGLVSVNTACYKTAATGVSPFIVCPIRIGLKELLDQFEGVSYDNLHSTRCADGTQVLSTFTYSCALSLSKPPSGYQPYDMDDELFLRWLKGGAGTDTGRLHGVLGGSDQFDKKSLLTTCARSRSILRCPTMDRGARLLISGLDALDNEVDRTWLHDELIKAFTGAGTEGQVLDDGDEGWSAVSGRWWDDKNHGYSGDYHFTIAGFGSVATWTFSGLPEGEYKVAATWPTISNPSLQASNAPYTIKDGPEVLGTARVNQRKNPSDFEDGGVGWQYLGGTYTINSGNLVVEISDRADGLVAADAVMALRLASEDEAEESIPPDHLVANLWAYLSQLSPTKEPFMVGEAYGVVPQLVITEAYAYSIPDDPATTDTDNGWAYAIELMNPTEYDVSGNYYLQCGTLNAYDFSIDVRPGDRVVIYDFGGKIGTPRATAKAGDFGFSSGSQAAGKLDFSTGTGGGKVLIGRDVGGEQIPVDSVSPGDFGYGVSNKQTDAEVTAIGQRDDNIGRGRALVGKMKMVTGATITGHTLGDSNGLTADDLSQVYRGFFIKKASALPPTLGDLIARYAVGPTTEQEDLPHKLVGHMGNPMRGRADYTGEAVKAGTYPAHALAALLGELLEMVPNDSNDNDPQNPRGWRYGRININTAPKEVLELLPFPAFLDINANGQRDDTEPEVPAADAADNILQGQPYHTPGAVAAQLSDYAADLLEGKEKLPGYPDARNSLYNAISNLITCNSDTFAVYMRVQIGGDPSTAAHHYVAVLDRSHCTKPTDQPVVLMLAQVD